MPEFKSYPPNTFCWTELMSTDLEKSTKFFSALFGWETNVISAEWGSYTMAMKGDKQVAGLYERSEDQKKMGVPSNWLSYVGVENVDEMCENAKNLGAQALMEPFDVMDAGRMVAMIDPHGAAFAMWQAKNSPGSALANEPGSFTWNELYANDVDGAGSFYTNLFGWGSETADMGGMKYTSFMNGERPAGGMMEIQKDWGDVPPNWMVYFAVANCDDAAKKIAELGGTVNMGPKDIPEVGRFAVGIDPTGAAFAIIQLANPQA
jgi:predicted enzyme related to lactoylglutathione lyase